MSSLAQIREPNPQVTSQGEQHGLLKVVANSVPNSEGKRFKEKDRTGQAKVREDQSKMVKAVYINKRGNHERLEMNYCLWDGDPILGYKFIPEQEYEVPKGLIDQVNNKKVTKRSGLLDKNGKELMQDVSEGLEHRFIPSGF